jgi:hypothetical protein
LLHESNSYGISAVQYFFYFIAGQRRGPGDVGEHCSGGLMGLGHGKLTILTRKIHFFQHLIKLRRAWFRWVVEHLKLCNLIKVVLKRFFFIEPDWTFPPMTERS